MSQGTLKWTIVGNVLVSFITPGQVPNETLALFLKDIETKSVAKLIGSNVGEVEVTSVQRKLAVEAVKRKGIPVAIVSDQKMTRGVVTAASWLGANIKAFSWTEMQELVEYLKIPRTLEQQVISTLMRLKQEGGA